MKDESLVPAVQDPEQEISPGMRVGIWVTTGVVLLLMGLAMAGVFRSKTPPPSTMLTRDESLIAAGVDPEPYRELDEMQIEANKKAAAQELVKAPMDDVGSVEEIEREMHQSADAKRVAFVNGHAVCPACRMQVMPGSTRCMHCTQEFSWQEQECDLCHGVGQLVCTQEALASFKSHGLHWPAEAFDWPACGGNGKLLCPSCHGKRICIFHKRDQNIVICVNCRGKGKLACLECGGDGKLGN